MPYASRSLPEKLLLALTLTATLAATSPSRGAGLDEMMAIHRDEAVRNVQGLLRADPGRDGWQAHASPAGEWLHVSGAPGVSADGNCPALLRHAFSPVQGGAAQSLCQYQGKVLLVVNTASQCGFTYQYEGLEALYRKYREKGLVVVGFPSNDFGGQEPGTNKDIAEFCRTKYGVQFPMFEKQDGARLADNPLYAQLQVKTGEKPRWNFHKYLVDRSGQRVQSYASSVEPGSRELAGSIERLLAERPVANRS